MDSVTTQLDGVVKKYYARKFDGKRVDLRPVTRFLGKMTDEAIANAIGVPPRKIRKFRENRRIEKFLSPETDSQQEIAENISGNTERDMQKVQKETMQVTPLEDDILSYFVCMAKDVDRDKLRVRKSIREIKEAIGGMYDLLEWHHILTAIKMLERMALILRINGVKSDEVNHGLHSKVTYQMNMEMFDRYHFRVIKQRATKAPTYQRKECVDQHVEIDECGKFTPIIDSVVSIKKEASESDSMRQIDPREEINSLEKTLSDLSLQLRQIDEGLGRLEEIRVALSARRKGLVLEVQGTSQKLDEARALWNKLEELFK